MKKDLVFTICLGVASALATMVLNNKAKQVRMKKAEEIQAIDIPVEEIEEHAK